MKTSLELLSQVSVASPCTADWEEMIGDEHARYCAHCDKNVYNLSALTTEAAIDLIREKEGNLCGRFFRRADGTMLTADCPIGLHHRIRGKRRLTMLSASLAGILALGGGCTRFDDSSTGTSPTPPAQQKVEKPCVMGEAVPPPGLLVPVAGGICPPKEMLMGKIVEEQKLLVPEEELPMPREARID